MRICYRALLVGLTFFVAAARGSETHPAPVAKRVPQVAALVTAYFHNSHADVIVSRLLQTMTLDDKGERPAMRLASLYVDQPDGSSVGLEIARDHHIPIYKTPAEALTLGGKSLAVDGVLLIGEHGRYPLSNTGQVIFPKRRLFSEILSVCDRSNRVVPVYTDKHLADNWQDAKWIYDQAHRRGMPLMAGSTLPLTWRYPPRRVCAARRFQKSSPPPTGRSKPTVTTDWRSSNAWQSGEPAARPACNRCRRSRVRTFGKRSRTARSAAAPVEAATARRRHSLGKPGEPLESVVKDPVLVVITYRDGLRAGLLWASNLIDFTGAWRNANSGKIESALFWTQEARPFMHFTYLVKGVEQMMQTGKPAWPVERTLLVTGVLNAYFVSKKEADRRIDTPWLDVTYQSAWDWHQPPPPPPGRPIPGQ